MANNPNVLANVIPHQFKQGNQASKGYGRPKGSITLQARVYELLTEQKNGVMAVDAIVMKLRQMAVEGDLRAAQLLFDRGFGPVTQIIQATNDVTTTVTHTIDYSKLSDAALNELRSAIIKSESVRSGDEPETPDELHIVHEA